MKKENNPRERLIFLLLSIGLFIFSLTQKCYCTFNDCGDSIWVFVFGALGFIGGFDCISWISWYANPLLLISWGSIKNNKVSYTSSFIAFILAISFLLLGRVIDNEAGHCNRVTQYKLGYWLWLASIATMLFYNWTAKKWAKRQ